jgi:hypothetical protein
MVTISAYGRYLKHSRNAICSLAKLVIIIMKYTLTDWANTIFYYWKCAMKKTTVDNRLLANQITVKCQTTCN